MIQSIIYIQFLFVFSFIVTTPLFSSCSIQSVGSQQDTVPSQNSTQQPVYTTSRLSTDKPIIDGNLDDKCWTKGVWAGNYTQFKPKEGGKPTYPTEMNIQYDDKNIYVAFRVYDYEPDKIQRYAGGRDEFTGDIVGVNFDSYHDYRTGFEFNLTAWGQKIDLILHNSGGVDRNWNAVWTGKVGTEDSAWVAEMEIPLSQLRYSKKDEQIWGLHSWRFIGRLQEESDWSRLSKTGPGLLYNYGELRGIKSLKKTGRLEVMPYSLGKLNIVKEEPGNPFIKNGRIWGGNIGLDAKLGISSNFTVDLTMNPDFGQVESDPSVMNLTAFETFFEEKRPFFLEGLTIFNYEFDGLDLFYSRRIGHVPSLKVSSNDSLFVKSHDKTTILSAIKLSGKTAKGFSVGFIQSLTANEKAKTSDSEGNNTRKQVEPLTNYMVARVQKQYNSGITTIGGMLTSTNRFINDQSLEFLTSDAYTGGLDLLHQWREQEFFIEAGLIGSYVRGSQQSITLLQESSVRYYQRPGADYLDYDTTSTNMSGFGGRIKIGKGSKGFWRYSTGASWLSPGLELNDLGYLRTTDFIRQENNLSYFVNQPVSIFRSYTISLKQYNTWNFNWNFLGPKANFSFRSAFRNKWSFNTNIFYGSQFLNQRILRGGYDLIMPYTVSVSGSLGTDRSKRISFSITTGYNHSGSNSYDSYHFRISSTLRPINALKFVITCNYNNNHNELQYVANRDYLSEKRYILGTIDQKTLGLTFRVDLNLTPELSVQYYGSPFFSSGSYSEFKRITNPEAKVYEQRFANYKNVTLSDGKYLMDENNDFVPDYSINNPDFNFYQFRSNFVAKWEYRLGSYIYFVWSAERTGRTGSSDASLWESYKQLRTFFPNNIFLIKLNFWFSL